MSDESEFTDESSPTEAIEAPQLDNADTLLGQDLRSDSLDVGYSPPDYEPTSTRFGTTAEEQRQGESLDQRLAEEEPDVSADDPPAGDFDEIDGAPDPRAGRLYARTRALTPTTSPTRWPTTRASPAVGPAPRRPRST